MVNINHNVNQKMLHAPAASNPLAINEFRASRDRQANQYFIMSISPRPLSAKAVRLGDCLNTLHPGAPSSD
jgi:hypothetical protein